jgi:drug/metabolite transporter (DMT)-like permease
LGKAKESHWLVFVLLSLTWGSSFILMKKGLKASDGTPLLQPAHIAGLRLSLAALMLLPVSLRAIPSIKRSDWGWLAVVGLVGSGIPAFLFANSQRYLDSGLAGILNSLTPFFTLLIGIVVFKRVISPRQWVGILLGLLGAVCLLGLKGFGASSNVLFGALVVLATFNYGISVNVVQHKIPHLKSLHITALSLLIAGIPYGIYLCFFSGIGQVVQSHPEGWNAVGYIAILAAAGTAMANMLYFWLTQQTGALFASSVTYVMPLVAVGWGITDGEEITWWHLLFGAIIILGVWLVNQRKS